MNQKGFTIIEVLIVLAIAGVIMLVVFLAVPALQRNSRNTQRTNDAALIVSAVNECLANNNGVVTVCDEPTGAVSATHKLPSYLDTTKLRQLTSVSATNAGAVDNALIAFTTRCDNTGSASTGTNASAKTFTVVYQVETNTGAGTGRCIES